MRVLLADFCNVLNTLRLFEDLMQHLKNVWLSMASGLSDIHYSCKWQTHALTFECEDRTHMSTAVYDIKPYITPRPGLQYSIVQLCDSLVIQQKSTEVFCCL